MPLIYYDESLIMGTLHYLKELFGIEKKKKISRENEIKEDEERKKIRFERKKAKQIESKKDREFSLEMLRRFDSLSRDELLSLTNFDSKYYLGKLKQEDTNAVLKIVKQWYDNKTLTIEKFHIIDAINESNVQCNYYDYDIYRYNLSEVPLTEPDYNQRLLILINDSNVDDYNEYEDYFQRYWINNRDKLKPIECDDFIVNRPCYLKLSVYLAKPHFHMGKRWFDEERPPKIKIYLFRDSLEYIDEKGHSTIPLSSIIDIERNSWHSNKEPQLLEITTRNGNKLYLSPINDESAANILILKVLTELFIKNSRQSVLE